MSKFGELTVNRWLSIIGIFALSVLLGYLAFQYARATDFPIGDDPAVHIHSIKTLSYPELVKSIYPIPLLLFKYVSTIASIDLPKLFTITISSFLFLASLTLFLFLYKQHGDLGVAGAGAVFFVTSRWVNDYLRMGTLPEVFGWTIFIVSLYCLASQRLIPTLLFSVFLMFSHPFAFTVYAFVALFYVLLLLRSDKPAEQRFARYVLLAGLGLAIVGWLIRPDAIQKFILFRPFDPAGWGDRSFWEIFARDDIRRILIPLLAFIGMATSVRDWDKPVIKIVYLLLIVGGFFSFNHLFDIHFLPFRFYAYLEIAVAIFAALGLVFLVRELWLPQRLQTILAVGFALFLAWPNYQVNQRYLEWQTSDPHAKAVLQDSDLEAMEWIRNATPSDAKFMAYYHIGRWIMVLGDRQDVIFSEVPYNENKLKAFLADDQPLSVNYIYYPGIYNIPPALNPYVTVVYNKRGVKIVKVKSVLPKATY